MRRRSLRSSLLSALPFGFGGNGFLDRIKAISFAMLGLTAAAALAMVAFVANQGWPQVGSLLPIPAAQRQAVSENSVVATPASGHASFQFVAPPAIAGVATATAGTAGPSSPLVRAHGGRGRGPRVPGDNVVVSNPAPGNPGAEPATTPAPAPASQPAATTPPATTPAQEAPSTSPTEAQVPSTPTAAPPVTIPPVSTPTTDPTPTTPDEGSSSEDGEDSGSEHGSGSERDHGHWGGHGGHVWHQSAPTPPTSTPPTTTPTPTPPATDETESSPPAVEDVWSGHGHGHAFGHSR
jgi:hypothetical protein